MGSSDDGARHVSRGLSQHRSSDVREPDDCVFKGHTARSSPDGGEAPRTWSVRQNAHPTREGLGLHLFLERD